MNNFLSKNPFLVFMRFFLGKKKEERFFHLAVNADSLTGWARVTNNRIEKAVSLSLENIMKFTNSVFFEYDIPVFSIMLHKTFFIDTEKIINFFESIAQNKRFIDEQVRVFVIGKWYDLPEDVVKSIKDLIESTENFDKRFLCFLVNYDGRDEIVSAIELITRKILNSRISMDEINEDLVKGELFSSYFPPPNIIMEYSPTYSGMFLWDSKGAYIYYTGKGFPEADVSDIKKAIEKAKDKLLT